MPSPDESLYHVHETDETDEHCPLLAHLYPFLLRPFESYALVEEAENIPQSFPSVGAEGHPFAKHRELVDLGVATSQLAQKILNDMVSRLGLRSGDTFL